MRDLHEPRERLTRRALTEPRVRHAATLDVAAFDLRDHLAELGLASFAMLSGGKGVQIIGLKDKDAFNASEPKDDAQFATYVTNPTLPALLEPAAPGR